MATVLEESGYTADRELKIVGTNPIRHDGMDKVTGRARFGADLILPGMLVGKVLRSPHPHALVKSIDTSAAEALSGVKAVVTRDDFPDMPPGSPDGDLTRNCMAREKVYYDGHPVAAVAATSEAIARKALKLIKVEYEKLPHVIDPVQAMQPDAPILHDYLRSKGIEGVEDKKTNITERREYNVGDADAGFAQADIIIERDFKTGMMHQSYIEPQACVASSTEDGQVELWCCTQGHFVYRNRIAAILKMDASQLRVTQSEIGGGFGGKTSPYGEPVAVQLSRKANRPVRIVMSRNEVFRSTGPVAGTESRVKIGATKDGRIVGAEAEMIFQTGAFTGSMFWNAPEAIFTRYNLENARSIAYEVVSNRPKVNAFRAPCVPQVVFGIEGVIDELARKLDMDPIELRLKNAMKEGDTTIYGETFGPIGFIETLEAAKASDHYNTPLTGPNQGRGISCGFWFNRGGETTGSLVVAPDGSITLLLGTPDVSGSRVSITMMAAEELGIPFDKVRAVIADTSSLGYNHVSAGSRVTHSSSMIVIESARKVIKELVRRASLIWDVPEDGLEYKDGHVHPSSSNVGEFEPLSIADIAKKAAGQGGAIAGHAEMNVTGSGSGFGVHLVDVEVDKETGATKILRYTVIEDAGKAIHPIQVEGQYQGGAAQGAGWALNEEYIYGEDGVLQNPGFLDYRIPVASDLPMIDTVIVEVANPKHPYGLRGVGEVPVVPTLAAIANAVGDAIGVRPRELPMSPPRLLKIIEDAAAG